MPSIVPEQDNKDTSKDLKKTKTKDKSRKEEKGQRKGGKDKKAVIFKSTHRRQIDSIIAHAEQVCKTVLDGQEFEEKDGVAQQRKVVEVPEEAQKTMNKR